MKFARYCFSIVLLLSATLMISCQKDDHDSDADTLQKPVLTFSGLDLTKAQMEMTVDVNNFGFNLFGKLSDGKDVFISPFSVSLALSMLTTGAAGNTEAELLKALGFEGRTTEELDAFYSLLIDRFKSADPSVETIAANSVWPDKNLQVKEKFIDDCLKYFSSEVNTVDYNDPSLLTKINDWCKSNTNGKITNMLNKAPDGPMTLINAIYFKAKWAFTFYNAKKGKDRMQAKIRTLYYEDDNMAMVGLPYGNGSFEMDVIVPGRKSSIETIGQTLDATAWNKILANSKTADVTVSMPEFELSWGSKSIKKELRKMGIEEAFGLADFSRMSPQPLFVDDVFHKTYVKVNKEGTEAAAVTVVEMKYTTAASPSTVEIPEVTLTVGDEFIFLIRDRVTGAILFIGQRN